MPAWIRLPWTGPQFDLLDGLDRTAGDCRPEGVLIDRRGQR
ncbi:hypothetical protein [Streptomyces griseoruber]|nr:hypothetical protein [Streptomyces griseoruber]